MTGSSETHGLGNPSKSCSQMSLRMMAVEKTHAGCSEDWLLGLLLSTMSAKRLEPLGSVH